MGDRANAVPYGVSIIDLDCYPPPDLVVEVANTSLSDDRGSWRIERSQHPTVGSRRTGGASSPNEEVVAMLLQLSREELLARVEEIGE